MKRSSDRQITKDDAEAGTLDGANEDARPFQKAPPDVMAKRRILKARRTLPADATNEEKAPNPFAAISTGPAPPAADVQTTGPAPCKPTNGKPAVTEEERAEKPLETPAAIPTSRIEETDKPADGNAKPLEPSPEAPKVDNGKSSPPPLEKPSEASADEKAPETSPQKSSQAAEKPADVAPPVDKGSQAGEHLAKIESTGRAPEEPSSKVADTPEVNSAPASANDAKQTAEGTADGAAKSVETEVPSPPDSSKATGTAAPTPSTHANGKAPAAPITFGNLSGAPALTFANAAAASTGMFNITPVATAPPPPPAPVKEFKEAPVETGEEGDEELFRERAKLYELQTGEKGAPSWKEKGVGHLKVNRDIETKKARLVMRTEATLKVILNSPIFEGFRVDRATPRSLRFLGYDAKDINKRLTFLARFGSRDASNSLIEVIESTQKTAANSESED